MKKLGVLLCVILFAQCKKEISQNQNLNTSSNIYETEEFSIRLYPEYKKISEREGDVLFSSKTGEISIIIFKENISQIRKFYALTSTSAFALSHCNAYLFIEKRKEGFKRLINLRIEIFPKTADIQITILALELEKNYNKIIDMLETITFK